MSLSTTVFLCFSEATDTVNSEQSRAGEMMCKSHTSPAIPEVHVQTRGKNQLYNVVLMHIKQHKKIILIISKIPAGKD